MWSWRGQVRSWCGRGTLVVRLRYARGEVLALGTLVAVEVCLWCGGGT